MNNINLIGRIARDPELKTTQNGISVCSFSVAVDRPGSKDNTVDFIPVVAWRGTAEFICRYFYKGQRIGLTGMLTARKYTDKSGTERTAFEVVANHTYFCEKVSDGHSGAQGGYTQPPKNTQQPAQEVFSGYTELDADGELPF